MNIKGLYRTVRLVGGYMAAGLILSALPLDYTVDNTSPVCFARLACAAEEPWKQEFNAICSKTSDSMALSREELKSLIDRCEKLKPLIERQEETTRKVYKKRLEMCKNLLVFVLESKK